ncbi:histidine kinase dimerization/phosphoacceptor domain -containing protein [Benzoatithermus flavus]|uniref:Histidine kinase dimerization/phosphoacceptor domain -containing protein n=1 Tax=Benzoatithermus flavus TaxID=3108223 RepID=A0ABU8XTA3_9PROT
MGHVENLDLTACDREPIHIPGSIQPHGLLLVADALSHLVQAGAGALEERLKPYWLGQPLDLLLAQEVAPQLASLPADATTVVLERRVRGHGEIFDAVAHRAGEYLVVELDPINPQPIEAVSLLGRLDGFARSFEQSGDITTLCERAAIAFRALTGFDRIMIYRFVDDEAGQVIAEDREPELASFLHHHFPGSDIPRQARALYVRNRVRSIPDVDYVPAPLRPSGFELLDLSDVGLRSVSPVHLQYLRNMEVAAAASFSIVRDGVLWGLVACHHASPRRLPRDVAVAGTALANALARQVQAMEQAAAYDERLRLRSAIDEMATEFSDERSAERIFQDLGTRLCRLLRADGFAYVAGGKAQPHGVGPEPSAMADLTAWALARSPTEPWATRSLSRLYDPAASWPEQASGLLMLPLADEGQALLWFRAEEPETVRWAGNPHEPAVSDDDRPLTPRASFATWVETVRGRSRAWTVEEIDAARRIGRAFAEARINRRIRRLNGELHAALIERDALLQQKNLLMKEIDHRVQNSLQIISSYLSLQAHEAGPGPVADHLNEAKARLSAVALVHRRLYRADQHDIIDLGQYLRELLDDLRTALGREWQPFITSAFAPLLVAGRQAMSIGLVMTELVLNASKYAYGGSPGPIEVRLERHHTKLRLSVKDEGRGRQAVRSSSGFGSRMIAATVGQLKGMLDYDDSPDGFGAVVTVPIES